MSTPPVAFLLLTLVDTSPPLDVQRARSAQAIVVLGGGVRRHAAEYGGDTLGHLTLGTTRYLGPLTGPYSAPPIAPAVPSNARVRHGLVVYDGGQA